MKQRWWLIAAVVITVLFTHGADADANLAWSPTLATQNDPGTWQRASDTTLILCAPTASTEYDAGTIIAFGDCAAFVYGCTADRPMGAGAGCPTPGSFTAERFLPKAQIATVAPPPPPPDPPPVPPSPVITLNVAPLSIKAGDSATVTWSVTNSEACALSFAPDNHATSGSAVIIPPRSQSYSMGCNGLQGAPGASASIFIQVEQPFTAGEPPLNWPLPGSGVALYEATTIDGHTVKVWGSDEPTGFVWYPIGFDPSRLVERLHCVPSSMYAALTAVSLADAWRACIDRHLSPTEQVVADALTQRWKPRFAVQGGATIVRRPVYTRNADGTRGVQLRIDNVLQYVVPGITCNGRSRLLGITTRYHLVSGETSQQGETLPSESFAQCVKNNPPVEGWLQ